MSGKAIIRGSLFLGISALLSRALGLLRDHLLASNFGALSGEGLFDLDTYYAAFRLPDLLFNLLVFGTLSAAFVPIFVGYLKNEQKEDAFKFGSTILNLSILLIAVFACVIFLFAPWIIPIYVPGFDAEKLKLTVDITRIILIAPIFFTISGVFQGIQNSFKTFFYYSLAPIIYNLSIIAGILFLSPEYGVMGPAWGVVIGAALHSLVQLPALFKNGFKYSFVFDFGRQDVKEMIKLTIPRIIGLSASQGMLIVETLIGSTLITGSITIMNYATNLQSLPIGVVGISAAVASFATLAQHANRDEMENFTNVLRENIRRIMFLIIPAAFGMLALRFQIVRLVLGRGKFGWEDTILTANTLGILLIGLFAHSLIFIMARAFYAWKDTKTPVAVSIVAIGLNAVVSFYLAKSLGLGVYGLAAGNALAATFNVIFLFVFLRKKLNVSISKMLPSRYIMKFLFASVVMLLAVQTVKVGFGMIFVEIDTYFELILQTGFSAAFGALVYFAIAL